MVEDEASVEAFKEFTIEDAGGAKGPPKPAEEAPEPAKEEPSPEPGKKESKPAPQKESAPTPDFGGPIAASPIARRLALEKGVPLKNIKGTGPGGRIIKSDVEKYVPAAAAAPGAPAAAGAGYTDIPLSGMRRTIAKRLGESMFTAPHYYLTSSINMTKTLKLRQALNDGAPLRDGKPAYRLSVNDFIIKAVSCALIRVPEASSQWLEKDDVVRQFSYVDISVFLAVRWS
jgi:pyruvate dehydrogenase E2 component (dihydrolipoamide acetyltransferase)